MRRNFPEEINDNEQLKKGFALQKKYASNITYHYHGFYEFELILSGKAMVKVNGNAMLLSRGGAYLLRPTDLHEFTANQNAEIYSLHFLSETADQKLFDAFLLKNDVEKYLNILTGQNLPDDKFYINYENL